MSKTIPAVLVGDPLEATWREIEKIGRSQGQEPKQGVVTLDAPSSTLRQNIDRLVAIALAEVSQREDSQVIDVTLFYDEEEEQTGPVRTHEKPSKHA